MSESYENPGRITILLHSGSYDKVTNAMSLAIVGLSMGMEVYVMLTYEALRRFARGCLESRSETDPELMDMMQHGVDSGKFHSIEEKLDAAKDLGLKIFACTTAMSTIGLAKDDLVAQVDGIMGLTTFVSLAKDASINWYI